MVIKRKMLLMALYSILLKKGYFSSANAVLHYLNGNKQAFDFKDAKFWCTCFGLNYSEWFNG